MQVLWHIRVGGWGVNGEALDEDGHEYDKADACKQHYPPKVSHPLDNGQ